MARIWTPQPRDIDDATLIEAVAGLTYRGCPPRSAELTAMLGTLSQRILTAASPERRPQYVALGYWLRPAALKRLSAGLATADLFGRLRVPRGVALHLPPTNVDTVIAYSWAMSVLAGNANVVRLARDLDPDTEWLVETICAVTAEHGQSERNLFCHFDYGVEVEAAIAAQCDLRLIWGGDAKVDAVSRVPIRPDGLSIGFPDRQSLAVLGAAAYRDAGAAERDALAAGFANDVFWFDQMGCGSPRLAIWLGDPGDAAADFYRRVAEVAARRGHRVEPAVAVSKFVAANDLLARGVTDHYTRIGNLLDVSRTTDPHAALERPHGGGFLCDWVAHSPEEIVAVVTRKVQTIAHYGLSTDDITRLVGGISGRGGYRVVPIGEALQFDPTWDGVDLFAHLTRQVVVRA